MDLFSLHSVSQEESGGISGHTMKRFRIAILGHSKGNHLRIRKRALRPSKGSGGIRGGSGTESRRDDSASGEEGLHILLTFFQTQAFNSLI